MDPDQIARFHQLLIGRLTALRETGPVRIDPLREDLVDKVDDDLAPLSEMSQVIASNRNRNRAADLRRMEAALRRLEREPDDFGLCEECEEPIALRRLELMPWVTLCVGCQSSREGGGGAGRRHLRDYG